ncbi:hypothetical protein QAD02_003694 [Eretmocerus hayati]|uniref:Uncharacterized protein n=1 Tax=Eretmocerus hayati TaxID=131215 RepID=A0ACC2NSB1_9HYME|nr:hypothetical protein QAD02_003694 [Eretmocerus hayati]
MESQSSQSIRFDECDTVQIFKKVSNKENPSVTIAKTPKRTLQPLQSQGVNSPTHSPVEKRIRARLSQPKIHPLKSDTLYAKMLIHLGVDMADTNFIHVQNFVNALNPTYSVPTPKKFLLRVVPRAKELSNQQKAGRKMTAILFIQTENYGNDDILVSMFIDRKTGVYIDIE